MSLVRFAFLIPALLLASCAQQSSPSWPAAPMRVSMNGGVVTSKASEKEWEWPLPEVIVDEPIRRLQFANLRMENTRLVADVSGATDQIKANDLVAEQYDGANVKISESMVHLPALKPGQSGQMWMFIHRGTVKVFIRFSNASR